MIFSNLMRYSTASTADAVYIIGGQHTEDIIAEFKDNNWRQLGNLRRGRYNHNSLAIDNQIISVGGYCENWPTDRL